MANPAEHYIEAINNAEFVSRSGRVDQFFGLIIEASVPDVFLGERCEITSRSLHRTVTAEVVGIRDGKALLMPFGDLRGISHASEVVATGIPIAVPVGEEFLGRVVDPFGNPLDGGPELTSATKYSLYGNPINPLQRPRIDQTLETGVRAIDSLLTIGRGQRVGIFAGSGVGKSTLMGMIARNMNADVNVIALVGERGREVLDFIETSLGEEGLAKSIVVVATSDQPALVRCNAAYAATSFAEYFRDQGKDVVLLMDSITRFAMAQRELGLAVGEPPTSRGYTPSVFATLSKLLERGGTFQTNGSITAFYTVLIESDDLNDPISDGIRAILDGSIVLSRDLANHNHYPAIDLLQSNSRLQHALLSQDELAMVRNTLKMISVYEKSRDMIELGAYKTGNNAELDTALKMMPEINEFLCQPYTESVSIDESMNLIKRLLEKYGVSR